MRKKRPKQPPKTPRLTLTLTKVVPLLAMRVRLRAAPRTNHSSTTSPDARGSTRLSYRTKPSPIYSPNLKVVRSNCSRKDHHTLLLPYHLTTLTPCYATTTTSDVPSASSQHILHRYGDEWGRLSSTTQHPSTTKTFLSAMAMSGDVYPPRHNTRLR